MTKPSKHVHLDILGKEILLDDVVAFCTHNNMKIGKVTKLNAKMIKVKELRKSTSRWDTSEHNKYSNDVIVINGPDAMLYVLAKT